ncbi:MAG TPA: hypothetical protein VK928_08030 [Longimicrobiales bacterium]|nr:hypothetical protein [Longimicrobiales bacterium]
MKVLTVALATTLAAVAPLAAQQHEGHDMGDVPAMCVLGGGHGGGHGAAAPAAPAAGEHAGHAQAAPAQAAAAAPMAMASTMTLWSHEFMMYNHHAKDFELTADQVARIETIRAAAQGSCTHHVHMSKQSDAAATAAFGQATPDMATFEAKVKESSSHVAMAHVAIAKAALEAFALLTPAQREKAIAERAEHAAKAAGAAPAAGGHTGH